MKTKIRSKNNIPILFENKHFIVFNKPARLLVIPSPAEKKQTLVNIVNQQLKAQLGDVKLHPCHRLDRETSGAILFAKGKASQKAMMDLFKERQIKKTYEAFIQGQPKRKKDTMCSKVKSLENQKYNRKGAKPAITHYQVKKTYPDFSVIEAEPVTGRANQIRIHFRDLGHPIVGDRKYAFAKDFKIKFKRVALHASRLEFVDPFTEEYITVNAPLAHDMELFLSKF